MYVSMVHGERNTEKAQGFFIKIHVTYMLTYITEPERIGLEIESGRLHFNLSSCLGDLGSVALFVLNS